MSEELDDIKIKNERAAVRRIWYRTLGQNKAPTVLIEIFNAVGRQLGVPFGNSES